MSLHVLACHFVIPPCEGKMGKHSEHGNYFELHSWYNTNLEVLVSKHQKAAAVQYKKLGCRTYQERELREIRCPGETSCVSKFWGKSINWECLLKHFHHWQVEWFKQSPCYVTRKRTWVYSDNRSSLTIWIKCQTSPKSIITLRRTAPFFCNLVPLPYISNDVHHTIPFTSSSMWSNHSEDPSHSFCTILFLKAWCITCN